MRKLLLLAMVMLAFMQANAQGNASVQTLMNEIAKLRKVEPGRWFDKIKAVGWERPRYTGDKEVDEILKRYQEYYEMLVQLSEDLVFYDVKLINDVTTGERYLAVVDENNAIRDFSKALQQYVDAAPFYTADGIEKVLNIPETVKILIDDPLRLKQETKVFYKAHKKFKELRKTADKEITTQFKQQKEILRLYKEWKKANGGTNVGSGSKTDDALISVPPTEEPQGIEMVDKSHEQIDAELDALGI